jgi:hypothetical protein
VAPFARSGNGPLADMSEVTYTGADGIARQAAGLAAWRGEDPAVSAAVPLEVGQRRLRAYDQAAREEE